MNIQTLVDNIDAEIVKLTHARNALANIFSSPLRVQPKHESLSIVATTPIQIKRVFGMSPEGRARIAAATKARWIAKREAAKRAEKAEANVQQAIENPRVTRLKKSFSTRGESLSINTIAAASSPLKPNKPMPDVVFVPAAPAPLVERLEA